MEGNINYLQDPIKLFLKNLIYTILNIIIYFKIYVFLY